MKISLQRRHAQTIRGGAWSHKIYYIHKIINFEGHQNRIIGSKVTAILLNWWILPIAGVASGRVCARGTNLGSLGHYTSQNH